MKSALFLAWRYVSYYRVRSGLLILCVALVALLPVSIELLLDHYNNYLSQRASQTPIVIGGKGSRYDLLLNTLFFQGKLGEITSMGEVERIQAGGHATAIPLFVRYSVDAGRGPAGGDDAAGSVSAKRLYPIVGTTPEYFEFRSLRAAEGTLPRHLGDAVVGARLAERLRKTRELRVGGTLMSAPEKFLDLAASYPLKMKVVGVLESRGTSDDWAVLVDIKTAWVIEGIGHGHDDLTQAKDPAEIIKKDNESITASAKVRLAIEITPENVESFHFHGDPGAYPVTSIIALAPTHKDATLLMGQYAISENAQYLKPQEVLDELLGLVLRVKRFFDANSLLVGISTVLFLALIVLLTLRLRAREIETLFKLGCARATVFKIQAAELLLVIGAGLAIAAGAAAILSWWLVSGGAL